MSAVLTVGVIMPAGLCWIVNMFLDKILNADRLKSSRQIACLGLLCLSMMSPLKASYAGALQIWPIEVSLDGTGDVVQVNVNNSSGADTFVQAMVVAWPSSDEPGVREPTDDVLVSPPVFDLAANDSQTIRLALRQPLGADSERSYRLVVTELAKNAGLVPNSLTVAVSMNMPVFVTPPGAEAKPTWSFANTDFDGPQLVVTNDGNAHINVKRVALHGADNQELVFESEQGGYVLAGEEKRWPIERTLTELKGPLALKIDTTNGPVEAVNSVAGR